MALETVLSRADTASLTVLFDKGLVGSSLTISDHRNDKHSLMGLVGPPGRDRHAMSATLDVLMEHGCQVNGESPGGYPIHKALGGKIMVLCQLLLDRGADPLQTDGEFGDTPLEKTARYGYRRLVQAMLQSLDQRSIPLEELGQKLDRAERMAEIGLESTIVEDDVRPLIRRFYWRKKYPCPLEH